MKCCHWHQEKIIGIISLSYKINSNYINTFFLKRFISTLGYYSIPYKKYNLYKGLGGLLGETANEIWDSQLTKQNAKINNPEQGRATGMSPTSERVSCVWWAHRAHQIPRVLLCYSDSSAVRTYRLRQFSVGVLLPFFYQFSVTITSARWHN